VMDDITNTPIGKKRRKSIGYSEGKENDRSVKLEIIERPPSFDYDLGINSAINRGCLVYKKLLQSLKSPKV
jgi:hypothetical protein